MIKAGLFFILPCFLGLLAQQNSVNTVTDAFISIATDARAAGQADIGVATSPDAYSQIWNPAKHVFSNKKYEVGLIQILGLGADFNQLTLSFYKKINERNAFSLSFRGYSYPIDEFLFEQVVNQVSVNEISLDGSYTLRLDDTFAMSIGGRYIFLESKAPIIFDFNDVASLYGIDISGFYYGNEIAYHKFNGRWRGGFTISNLRGKSNDERKKVEIYAPTMLKTGAGFDFIFNKDYLLGITTEYKMLLDSYTENAKGEALDYGLEGAVVAMGLEFTYLKKLTFRNGYSYGLNRLTDSFISIGAGFRSRYTDIDIAILTGLSEQENLARDNLRLSLGLDLEELFSNLVQ